jgi:hypothetical protein
MRTAIIIHMGVSDHINLQGLVRYYASLINGTLVLMDQGNCTGLLHAMYSDLSNVEICTDLDLYPNNLFDDDYTKMKAQTNNLIRVGFHLCKCIPEESFIDTFYLSKGLDPKMRYTNFIIPEQIKNESKNIYNDFIKIYGDEYILIHEDPGNQTIKNCTYTINRGNFTQLDRKYMNTNYPIINLNLISDKIIDYYDIILNAKEIHLIDSCWANVIYNLMFNEEKLKTKPIFIHYYARSNKNFLLYESPKHESWNYIY